MPTSFTTEMTLPVTLPVKDGRGRKMPIEAVTSIVSSDETVAVADAAVKGADDVWGFNIASVTPGTARIVATADADVGEGVNELTAFIDVEVTLDPRTGARIMEIVPGEPTEEPIFTPSGN